MSNGPSDAPWAKPRAPFYSHPDFVWFSAECPPDYCLMIIDRAGTIRFINRVRPDQEIDQVLGTAYVDQFAESDRPDIKLILDRVFSDAAETVVFEATGTGPKGAAIPYKTRIQPLMANDSIPYALLMFVEMSKVPGESEGETLTVCAWTNRVKLADDWLPLEAYLKRKYGLRISHGMSPEAHQMMAEGVFDPGTSNVPGVEAAKSRLRRTARVFLDKPKKPESLK